MRLRIRRLVPTHHDRGGALRGYLVADYGSSIFLFRRDLRISDNIGRIEASKASKTVVPLFVFDRDKEREIRTLVRMLSSSWSKKLVDDPLSTMETGSGVRRPAAMRSHIFGFSILGCSRDGTILIALTSKHGSRSYRLSPLRLSILSTTSRTGRFLATPRQSLIT